MLQRQLGQLNVRHRARAFSLSDVYSSKREKSTLPLSPLAMDNSSKSITTNIANKSLDISKTSNSNQKTVTIMSPAKEMITKSEPHDSTVPMAPVDMSNEQSWKNQQNVTPAVNPFAFGIIDKSSTALNESIVSHRDAGRYHQGDGSYEAVCVPVHDKQTTTGGENVFVISQRSILNDTLDGTIQRGTQEIDADIKNTLIKAERKQDADVCVIDNLGEPQTSSSMKSSMNSASSFGLRKEKPSVPIDFYKPLLQVTIEKPAVNPFEQYRDVMRCGRKEDTDLKEVKVEKTHEKCEKTENQ